MFIFLYGETKQLSLIWNYWALLSIYGNLIYATESTCFRANIAAYFNDLKDEESFVMQLSMLCRRGGPRDRVGPLIKNKNLGSNFPTLGITFQFKVQFPTSG